MENQQNIRKTGLALLAGAASLVISACGTGEASVTAADTERTAAAVPVEVTLPMRASINATYETSATITSDADTPVVAKVGGEVVELLAEEGQRVTKGQVLARLDGERLHLEMLSAGANLRRARREYQRNLDLHEKGLVSASMFEGLRYDVDALQAAYDLARLNYDYSSIRASIAGVVSERLIKPGQHLTAGAVAFRITDASQLLAYLKIPQAELPKFASGHSASLKVAAMPDETFSASIARISPTIDVDNGTFRATAHIDNAEGRLAPGMFGRFRIAYERHNDALLIPAAALIDEDDAATVYIVNDDEVTRRNITIGIRNEGFIEVLDGLSMEDRVVVVGHSALRDGSKVLASTTSTARITG